MTVGAWPKVVMPQKLMPQEVCDATRLLMPSLLMPQSCDATPSSADDEGEIAMAFRS